MLHFLSMTDLCNYITQIVKVAPHECVKMASAEDIKKINMLILCIILTHTRNYSIMEYWVNAFHHKKCLLQTFPNPSYSTCLTSRKTKPSHPLVGLDLGILQRMCGSSRLSTPESAHRNIKHKKQANAQHRFVTLKHNAFSHEAGCLKGWRSPTYTLGFITHRFLVLVSNSELVLQRVCHPPTVKLPLLPVRGTNKSLLTHDKKYLF